MGQFLESSTQFRRSKGEAVPYWLDTTDTTYYVSMGKAEILGKVDLLLRRLSDEGFQERDVVYLLVELHKVKEREIGRRELRVRFPYLAFFRDWTVHTHMHDSDWVERRETLNNPEALVDQLGSILEDEESRHLLSSARENLIASLMKVVSDQEISLRT